MVLKLFIDFFGPRSNGRYWFVNHDEYFRWVDVEEVSSCAFENVRPILENLFSKLGTPISYKTDNGAPFHGYKFAEFAKRWGFEHRRITRIWPRANACVESFMKKLGKVLKAAELEGEDKRDALIAFLRVYRETPHSSTGVASSMLLLGYS